MQSSFKEYYTMKVRECVIESLESLSMLGNGNNNQSPKQQENN